ncbi:MAG TPA: hypothetical protein ENK57_12335, partial [Polyangiaceae bacterium]|nr:hypothetical protein [Polyangiaceae bacterium]
MTRTKARKRTVKKKVRAKAKTSALDMAKKQLAALPEKERAMHERLAARLEKGVARAQKALDTIGEREEAVKKRLRELRAAGIKGARIEAARERIAKLAAQRKE